MIAKTKMAALRSMTYRTGTFGATLGAGTRTMRLTATMRLGAVTGSGSKAGSLRAVQLRREAWWPSGGIRLLAAAVTRLKGVRIRTATMKARATVQGRKNQKNQKEEMVMAMAMTMKRPRHERLSPRLWLKRRGGPPTTPTLGPSSVC